MAGRNSVVAPSTGATLAILGPMCRVLYRLLVSLARLAVRSGRSKDLEIIVLRHQLAVLHRQNSRDTILGTHRV